MEHMIEITVSNGVVERYRRLVCSFYFIDDFTDADNDIIEAYETMGDFYSEYTVLLNAQVGYLINMRRADLDYSTDILPRWFFETEMKLFDFDGSVYDSLVIPFTGPLFRWR
jgi:hypothetical protein